jgi:hypothetical protein
VESDASLVLSRNIYVAYFPLNFWLYLCQRFLFSTGHGAQQF